MFLDLQKKIQSLEAENKKMHTEFNTQRAKLKDLFIQKEAEYTNVVTEKNAIQRELDELKSLVMVAECRSDNERELIDLRTKEEISSLQLLVQGRFPFYSPWTSAWSLVLIFLAPSYKLLKNLQFARLI